MLGVRPELAPEPAPAAYGATGVHETERDSHGKPGVGNLLIDPREQERALLLVGHDRSGAEPDCNQRNETDEQARAQRQSPQPLGSRSA